MSLRPCILKLSSLAQHARRNANTLLQGNSQFARSSVHGSRGFLMVTRDREVGVAKRLRDTGLNIDNALATRDADSLRQSLADLRKLMSTLPFAPKSGAMGFYFEFTPSKLKEMIKIYADTGQKEDAASTISLLYDCITLYNVQVDADTLALSLQALVNTKQTNKAYRLLQRALKHMELRPGATHWQIVMGGYASLGNAKKLKDMINLMKARGPFPTRKHYHLLLIVMDRDPNVSMKRFKVILDEMKQHRVTFHSSTLALLERKGLSGADWQRLAEEYRAWRDIPPLPAEQIQNWMKELIDTLEEKGRKAFELHLLRLQHKGFFVNEDTLDIIIERAHIASADTFLYLRAIMGIEKNPNSWVKVIKNALEKYGNQGAIKVYEEAKLDIGRPSATILRPLITDLTSLRYRDSEAMLDQALRLLSDLDRKDALPSDSEGKRGDDIVVYNLLLRSLATSTNTEKYFPIALDLLDEMRRRNVAMDSMSTSTIAVMLIRSASTFEEAEEAYELIAHNGKNFLDAKGYVAVFNAVCDLEIKDPTSTNRYRAEPVLPPPNLYYRIIQDMQDRGFPKTVELYTSLLYRHAMLASRVRRMKDPKRRGEGIAIMLDVIESTHREINADPDIKMPDGYILNVLMDAYNRIGSMTRVLEVWSLLVSTGRVNNASVSVILDAIGHNRARDKFDVIYKYLADSNFPWNQRNYNALLECLCRLGQLDAALNFAFKDMGEHVDPEMRPDVETIKVLGTFGVQAKRGREIFSQLKTRFPVAYEKFLQDKSFIITDDIRAIIAYV